MKRNRIMAVAATLALLPTAAQADITVEMPAESGQSSIEVTEITIEAMLNARSRQDLQAATRTSTVEVKDGKAVIKTAATPAQYAIAFADGLTADDIFAAPGDELRVNVTSVSPLAYTVRGTELMDGITRLTAQTAKLNEEGEALMAMPEPDVARLQQLTEEFERIMKDYVTANPDNQASAFAVYTMNGEGFLEAEAMLGDNARKSVVYPLVENRKPMIEYMVELDRKQKALASGTVDAPGFTLENLEGEMVSLSDFRGKWVILDFWGSWCIWCIRGFPHLKEVYAQLSPELEVIGIDCRDSKEVWKKAVEKYELPWVNVYNPENSTLEEEYTLQGFPTKAIVNPEGKIVDITTGEDPGFYDRLMKLMGK